MAATQVAYGIINSMPGLIPVAGLGLGLLTAAIVFIISFGLLCALYPAFRHAFFSTEDNSKSDGLFVLGINLNMFAYLGGAIASLIDKLYNVLRTLTSLSSSDLIRLFIVIILAIFLALVWIPFHNVIFDELTIVYVGAVVPVASAFLELVNAIALLAAVVLPGYNIPVGLMSLLSLGSLGSTVLRRVIIDCGIGSGAQVSFNAFLTFIQRVVLGVIGIVEAIVTWLRSGDLLHTRIEFSAALTLLFSSLQYLSAILSCACALLSNFVTGLFALFVNPFFILTLDCALNIPVAFFQSIVIGVRTPMVPQINTTIEEAQCVLISATEFVQVVVLFLFTSWINFIEEIAQFIASDAEAVRLIAKNGLSLVFPFPSMMGAWQPNIAPLSPAEKSVDVMLNLAMLRHNQGPMYTLAATPNITNFTMVFDYFITVLESPYAVSFGYAGAGVLALVNGTWSLSAQLGLPFTFNNIQYFQLGFIFDWFQRAFLAGGQFLGAIFTIPALGLGLGGIAAAIVQLAHIILDILVWLGFYNGFYPAASLVLAVNSTVASTAAAFGAFQPATVYCYANNTQAFYSQQLVLNATAEIAIGLGCNQTLNLVPISSPAATCRDNVLACFALSISRLLNEVFIFVTTFICALPEMFQFLPPLFFSPPPPQFEANPSNPPLRNFANVSIDGMTREWLNLGYCFQGLFYLLDNFTNNVIGFPTGVPCQSLDASEPTGILYRISIFCSLGGLSNTLFQFSASLVYPVILNLNVLLGSIAYPILITTVRIPTWVDATNDLTVILCNLGGAIASLIPVSFSCSRQAGGTGDPLVSQLPPPSPQYAFYPPVTNVSQRTNTSNFCTYNQSQWAGPASNVTCNCAAISQWYQSPPSNVSAACLFFCLNPGVPFRLGFGTNISVPQPCLGLVTSTVFSAPTNLKTFLNLPFAGVTGVNPGPLVNPTNVSTYPPGTFMQALATAYLNMYYNNIYNPSYTMHYSTTANPVCTNIPTSGNGLVDSAFTLILQEANDKNVTWLQVIDYIHWYFYGNAQGFVNASNPGGVQQSIACYFSTFQNTSEVHYLAPFVEFAIFTTVVLDAINVSWALQAKGFEQWLSMYNNAFPSCDNVSSTYAQCFPTVRIPATSAPDKGVFPNASQLATFGSFCTFSPAEYDFPNPACTICAANTSIYYAFLLSGCLQKCDPPNLPLLIGQRDDHCVTPSGCTSYGHEVNTVLDLSLSVFDPAAPFPPRNPLLANQIDTWSGNNFNALSLVNVLMAARLNLLYLRRYRPGNFVYLRSVGDTLLSPACLNGNQVAKIIYGGFEISDIIDVINDVFIGSNNFPYNCSVNYLRFTRKWQLCSNLQFNVVPSITLSTWTNMSLTYLFPILREWNAFMGQCQMQTTCFFVSTVELNDLNVAVPGVPLTNFQFTNPQFYTLQPKKVAQLVPCVATTQCFFQTLCSVGETIGAVLSVFSSILEQFNIIISGGVTAWFLGNDFFKMLTPFLLKGFDAICNLAVEAAGSLDCIICAISGNTGVGWFCSATLFTTFKFAFRVIQVAGEYLIELTVALISFLFNALYFLLKPDIAALWGALVDFLGTLGQITSQLIDGLVGFIFGQIGACGFLNTIAPNITCFNAQARARKRSFTEALSAAATSFAFVPLFQLFAPTWPVQPYTWRSGTPCNKSMTTYAQIITSDPRYLFTEREADEMAYCLSFVTLFDEVTANTSAYYNTYELDECVYMAREYKESTTPFAQLDVVARAMFMKCLSSYGIVYAHKQNAEGALDWLPNNLLRANAMSPYTWFAIYDTVSSGLKVSAHATNDATLPTATLRSPTYLAQLQMAYGPGRVALARAAAETGTTYPVAFYAEAILNRGKNLMVTQNAYNVSMITFKKRAIEAMAPSAREDLVQDQYRSNNAASFALLLHRLRDNLGSMSMFNAQVDMEVLASLAPAYEYEPRVNRAQQLVPTTETQARIEEVTNIPQTTRAITAASTDAAHRVVGSVYKLLTIVPRVGQLLETTNGENSAPIVLSLPRGGGGGRRRVILANASMIPKRPSILAILAKGFSASTTMVSEITSGRAWRNATAFPWAPATPDSQTSFLWRVSGNYATWAHRDPMAWLTMGDLALTMLGARPLMDTFVTRLQKMVAGISYVLVHSPTRQRQEQNWRLLQSAWDQTTTAIYTQGQTSAPYLNIAATNTTNGTFPVPGQFCFNTTGTQLCTECFILDQTIGYAASLANCALIFYNSTNNQTAATIKYALANFDFFRLYLLNDSMPMIVGPHPGQYNSARFFKRNLSVWDTLDDQVPNKVGFSKWQPLFDATLTWLNNLISSISTTDFTQFTISDTSSVTQRPVFKPVSIGLPSMSALSSGFALDDIVQMGIRFAGNSLRDAMNYIMPSSSTRMSSSSARSRPLRISVAANYTTLGQILAGYLDLIYTEFIFCTFNSEVCGTNVHYSLAQAAVILAIPALILAAILAAFTALIFPVISGLNALTNFLAVIVMLILMIALPLAVIVFWIGLATGFKLLCLPMIPPILASAMGMQFLVTTVFNKCAAIINGLVAQPNFDGSNCMLLPLWQNGTWSSLNCKSDLGWTSPLDVPVFFLHVYFPTALTTIQNPNWWPSPLNTIVASSTVQTWLHRWDSVNVFANDVIYSNQLTCLWEVEFLVFFVYLLLIIYLLQFGPLASLLPVAGVLLQIIFYALLAALLTAYYLTWAPHAILIQERRRARESGETTS